MIGNGPARWLSALAIAVALSAGVLSGPARSGAAEPRPSLPTGFSDQVVWSGLDVPTAVAFAPDGRVFVAEKRGVIKVFSTISDPTPTIFSDFTDKTDDDADRGFLGLAVDPKLGTAGHNYVYALYTRDAPPGSTPPVWNDGCPANPGGYDDGCVVTGNLARIEVNPDGTAGKTKLLIEAEWCQQFESHSIGHLAFGPDGMLYVSGGDGASFVAEDYGQFGGTVPHSLTPANPCGDPPGGVGVALTSPTARGGALRTQSMRRPAGEPVLLNGALLRVNPKNGAGVAGNPAFDKHDKKSNASRIVAYGFRNPFRFTFRPGTSEVWVADVGWDATEEIDRVANVTVKPAQNFGWPCYEGPDPNPRFTDLDMCQSLYADTVHPAIAPFDSYTHGVKVGPHDSCTLAAGSAVISAISFTAANSNYPRKYQGALFFADHSRDCIWVEFPGANGLPDHATLRTFVDDRDTPYPVDIETDPASGDLFYVAIDTGSIHRISYAP